jgi:hypothetical protein
MRIFWALLLLPAVAMGDVSVLRAYGSATTVDVCLADYSNAVDLIGTATFEAGDVTVMKDEGAPANIGTLPTDEGTCYSLPLTSTEMEAARVTVNLIDQTATKVWMDEAVYIETYGNASALHSVFPADVLEINGNSTSATQLALSAATIESGAAEGTPSTTVIQTDLAETQDDIYIGRVVIFTSGAARGEATSITDYTGSTGTLTVTALANAPAAGDTFVIL